MSPLTKETTLSSGYAVFLPINELQWVALKIAQDATWKHKDIELRRLVEACKITKNKEIAFLAANSISDSKYKTKYLAQINSSNYFK